MITSVVGLYHCRMKRPHNTLAMFVGSIVAVGFFCALSIANGENPTPQSVDEIVTERLYRQYIVQTKKISSSSVDAAIVLVATRAREDRAFKKKVLEDFETSCDVSSGRYDSRNLLRLISKMLYWDSRGRRAYERQRRTGKVEISPIEIPSAFASDQNEFIYPKSETLARIMILGRQCERNRISRFVLAVRTAHHPQGNEFLLDVLRSRDEDNNLFAPVVPRSRPVDEPKPAKEDQKRWPETVGGVGNDAKYHAAVALAELGNHEGVEWLIRHDNFGSGYISRAPHHSAPNGSCRASCLHALADLSGKEFTEEAEYWKKWWVESKHDFMPGNRVSLRID